jgi:hypothetical protein
MRSKARSGFNPSGLWYETPKKIPKATLSTRHSGRKDYFDSKTSFFPAKAKNFDDLPALDADKGVVCNYALSSRFAFTTNLQKTRHTDPRTFYPHNHPEFQPEDKTNHRKRDRVVEFREAML